ncbi:dihydrofolate reductase family protein [Bosea sp. BIWAKO-01]|uniref:dihydrofolate reductase family protein n=1 Tax=Bosea sp. BIWAKO-01 TaxID=506668 RepID=UPI0008537151|nr:dihydrofolate reductase family protein [Bosea sp. BIWAKO-01]GAU83348.1 dihydrofolate reductase [Bosea sp. BIWAKO-01]
MRNVVAATFLSLDGVIQAPGGPEEDSAGGFSHGGWTFHYWDEPMGEVMEKAFAEEFDLLLGRKTYDIFAAHWPHAGDDPVAMKFNACIKYVATSAPKTLNWQNSVALRGEIAAEVAALKRQDGPKLLLQGSSELIQLLLAKDLIDEFNLLIFPVVLGAGKRLFGEGTMPAAFTLVESRVSSTGVIMATYRRAGAVTTGSFVLPAPSEDEIARCEKNLSAA